MNFSMNYKVEHGGEGRDYIFRCPGVENTLFREIGSFSVTVSDPVNTVWVGRFESGPGGISGVFPTPCENTVCVINKGQGYWVPVLNPQNFKYIPSIPIKEMFKIFEVGLVIFKDNVSLVAYDKKGLRWRTPRISYDGIRIEKVDSLMMTGWVWDGPSDTDVHFSIILENGKYTGGCNSL